MCLCPATWSLVCGFACLSRSSLTVAVSVWLVTLRPVQVSALTRMTVTGCSHTSWLSLSSLPSSSPLAGHQATCFLSGQIQLKDKKDYNVVPVPSLHATCFTWDIHSLSYCNLEPCKYCSLAFNKTWAKFVAVYATLIKLEVLSDIFSQTFFHIISFSVMWKGTKLFTYHITAWSAYVQDSYLTMIGVITVIGYCLWTTDGN